VDAESLAAHHPRVIPCSISGYGADGPWADRKAYDLMVQAETGLMALTGSPEEPARPGISIADIAAGMYAYTGILTALYRRATTGWVSSVDVSLFDALAEWMGSPLYYTRYAGQPPQRTGAQHPTIAPYGPFTTAEGDTLLLGIQNEREWRAFCAIVLDDPAMAEETRFATNSQRVAHRAELNELISTRFAILPTDAAIALLDKATVANSRLNPVTDLVDHPVLTQRDRWRGIDTPNGPIEALLPPARLSNAEPTMGPVPSPGQHTDAILRELGRDDELVAALHADGIV
jgi:formyl-CoA transferase